MEFNTPILVETPASGDVTTFLQQIVAKSAPFDLNNSKSRKELLAITRSLFLALETPMEAILRMEWAEVSATTA
jgi:hypothetical protein